ncbi:hypothetical protein Glove_12g34 [Diversispora epigaea]|uniref:Uncharacterized protein n=1 Tax=Diversispora epigaea TaxID=1348612 RepID=A0A397JS22_9GLOM|nr:hypothetical protein Glove_12g34 [Diversispora epigaea]
MRKNDNNDNVILLTHFYFFLYSLFLRRTYIFDKCKPGEGFERNCNDHKGNRTDIIKISIATILFFIKKKRLLLLFKRVANIIP